MLPVDPFAGGIPGDYQIERLLGQSQLGAAYVAQQPAHGRQVMITIFNLPGGISAQDQEQMRLRFAREGEALIRLTHPHLVPIYAFGMQSHYVYLVTAFMKDASLGQFLKQNVRFTPQQTLSILRQLAAGLDYIHGQGVVHGMLSLSNVVVSSKLDVRITGFGLRTMLELHGNAQSQSPLAHLTSGDGTFLGSPEYISPERVLGMSADARSDIYALGVILFELLSGIQPFSGTNPLDIALLRLQQPVPSVHAACPEVPEAFDLVLKSMLERDPAKRARHAGEITIAFERLVKTLDPAQWALASGVEQSLLDSQVTLPPTVNWFDEPMVLSAHATSSMSGTQTIAQGSPEALFAQSGSPAQARNSSNSLGGVDPFAWWTGTSNGLQAASPTPGTLLRRPPVRLNNSRLSARPQSVQQGRRKLVTLIATSTVAVGVLTIGGISFAHLVQSMKQSQVANGSSTGLVDTTGNTTAAGTTPAAGSTPGTQGTPGSSTTPGKQNTPGSSKTPGTQNTPGASSTPTPQSTPGSGQHSTPTPQPTQQQQPTPTPQPQPTPTPSHTGTVIGHTSIATNSATTFTNPADGQGSLLIHLASGSFVACERACTHAGVPVNYNTSSQQLVCPAHGAIFDPQSFAHLSGPGSGSLAKVSITVNGDGTITTG
jgi:serine/threonine protein kinase